MHQAPTAPLDLLAAWEREPEPHSEGDYTPDGHGWRAWNRHSPEVEFAEFAASLVRLTRPGLVIETGVGQGYTTRRVLDALHYGPPETLPGVYLGYEADDLIRDGLQRLPDRWDHMATIADRPSPSDEALGRADLVILDTAPTARRLREFRAWQQHGRRGSVCLMHDVRADHPRGKANGVHRSLARAARAAGPQVEGVMLPHPRGCWLGRKR